MRKYIFCFSLILFFVGADAQETLMSKGNKVFIENKSKNENALKAQQELEKRLKEWAYWNVVDQEAAADFKINMETSASKGITATSWGGTSFALIARIKDKKDQVIWESDTYKSSPNGTNGFNSGAAVVKKLIRDLKKKYAE